MTKKTGIFLVFLLVSATLHVFAQKPVIDSSVYGKWAYADRPVISNDGKYVFCDIRQGSFLNNQSICQTVQSTATNWKLALPKNIKSFPRFSADSKYFFYVNSNDSLVIVSLGSIKAQYIQHVSNYNISEQGSGEWIFYQLNNEEKKLLALNLKTGKEISYQGVLRYFLSADGKILALQRASSNDSSVIHSLDLVALANGKISEVYKGKEVVNIILDTRHDQMVFKTTDSLWHYKFGMSHPIACAGIINGEFTIDHFERFSNDGERLFFELNKKEEERANPETGIVEVWSYRDVRLQSRQQEEKKPKTYKSVISLNDYKIIRLRQNDDDVMGFGGIYQSKADKLFLTYHLTGNGDGEPWSAASQRRYKLINAETGEIKLQNWLNDKTGPRLFSFEPQLSPEGKYILFYDADSKGYFTYNISSGDIIALSKNIHTSWIRTDADDGENFLRGIAAWLPDDEAVFVYDAYDIWKLDPSGKSDPVNLTNGYGLKHHIIFNIAIENELRKIPSKEGQLLLSAFNHDNKENGFFKKSLNKKGDPELLTMGAYMYTNSYNVMHVTGFTPIKANNAEVYIVKRQSPTEAPNFFSTSDFKTFKRLTDVDPHKEYNWYTTELHTWKSLNGQQLQGILYKPENFDLNKKYPVIFEYYQKVSDGLNAYLMPESNGASIDIPTYVSQGYIVFCPDIYYKTGDPMQGTYDAVVSAARYVASLPFVNPKKMGIQGHSWGGIQTNYLVTRTDLFAAACSSSGLSNIVTEFGSMNLGNGYGDGGTSMQGMCENGQIRMGTTLWENLAGYVKNSSVFFADKVNTPLLMKHGKKDGICNYTNAMEFFLGLRRLGKKAWILVYPEARHTLNGKASADFSIRMMQFFDHYLKNKPAPVWMTRGIPESRRGIDDGYEFDNQINTPGPGLLIPEEQEKVDSLMNRKQVNIIIK